MIKTLAFGSHLRVLGKNYPMNANMTGFRWFSKNPRVLVLWMRVASALEGLTESLHCAEPRYSKNACSPVRQEDVFITVSPHNRGHLFSLLRAPMRGRRDVSFRTLSLRRIGP